ncbi:Coiled-coil domain-containing protein, partial [Globisporangium splendens]
MEANDAIPVLNRIEQQRHYGLDCGDSIRFDAGTWAPGGERVKKISVRNVSHRTIKFKYELPTTKYFSMEFPTAITLSPGMQTVLDVAFRPVKLEEYDDFVTFNVHIIEGGVVASSGKFKLPVIARIASLAVELPAGIDFGFIDALFEWSIPGAGDHGSPFAVHPASGRVKAGETIELTASFCPDRASVYVTTTACLVRPDGGESFASAPKLEKLVEISGISKFTYLSASESELNFGEILVGAPNTARAPTEKEFVLRNRSLVHAGFRVVNVENDHDPVLFFSPLQGVVGPESSLSIKVRYTSLSAGTFTCDHFDVLTPGGNTVRITCKGKAVGPVVSVWKKNLESNFVTTKSVNFQDVQVGKTASRVITLRNESPTDVHFHFSCQRHGVFHFDNVNGKILPHLDVNVMITFTPTQAGNFYRRFFLLVHNQSTQFVDVLGTGHDDKTRPSPFQQAHVDAYHLRVSAGLGLLSPDQLETYWQDHGDELFLQGVLRRMKQEESATNAMKRAQEQNRSEDLGLVASPTGKSVSQGSLTSAAATPSLPPLSQVLTRSGEASIADVGVCHEYFISVEEKGNAAVVISELLDFGNCGIVQFPSKKTLRVTDNTHGKVTCTWRVPMASTNSEDASSSSTKIFQIFPESSDIGAGGTCEFRIAFQPTQVNAYYFAELEGFVSFKSNRTFRLVNVETFTPPWCLVSNVCGNTFAPPTEQFLSKLAFRVSKQKVHFPPCYLGDSVFQTILMENASDTPALFSFVTDPSEIFDCKPQCGYIAVKSFQLVQIRFSPRKTKKYTHMLQCIVNNARSRPNTIELTGTCALPALVFEDQAKPLSTDAKVFIKPTSIGLRSVRSIRIANASRVPLVFRWEIPRKHQVCVNRVHVLSEGDTRLHEPLPRHSEAISLPWNHQHLQHNQQQQSSKTPVLQESTVKVQTKGTLGAILFEPPSLQFEAILVNTSSRQSFFIVNVADCDLQLTLHQHVKTETATRNSDDCDDDGSANNKESPLTAGKLAFSEHQGCISAHSRKKITATFLPTVAGKFAFEVSCVIATGDIPQSLVSPYDRWSSLVVGDDDTTPKCIVLAESSFPTIIIEDIRVPRLSTQLAWRQFQCREINEFLTAPLTKEDEQKHDDGGRSHVAHLAQESEAVDPALKHFAIPFSPASIGSETEQVFLKLKNPGNLIVAFRLRKVFGISPRKATLLPYQSVVLALSYSYTFGGYGGVHDLPIYLEVDKGKRMVLEFQGRTLGRGEPKLFLPQRVFELSPVMLGEYRRFVPHSSLSSYSRTNAPRGSRHYDEHEDALSAFQSRPPAQQIEVFNRGDCAFRLDIECQSLAKINRDNFEYPILNCPTTSEIVPAKSSIFLDIEFNPLEAKTIEAQLILKAHGLMGKAYKEAAMITIVATGFHPKHSTLAQERHNQMLTAAEPPRRQLIRVPEQPACFVSDLIDFSHVPMYSQVDQLLILQNELDNVDPTCSLSQNDRVSMSFEWDKTHPLIASGVLRFAPSCGELAPSEKAVIRVSVHPLGEAIVINHDVACFITYRQVGGDIGSSNNNNPPSPAKSPSIRATEASTSGAKLRDSVVNRSTATQEAAGEKTTNQKSRLGSRGVQPGIKANYSTDVRKGAGDARNACNTRTAKEADARMVRSWMARHQHPQRYLYVRAHAHIIPQTVFEQSYPRDQVKRMPVAFHTHAESPSPASLAASPPSREVVKTPSTATSSTIRSGRAPLSRTPLTVSTSRDKATNPSPAAAGSDPFDRATCRDVLYDVMEALAVDALSSAAVQDALDQQVQPLPRGSRALAHVPQRSASSALLPPSNQASTLYPNARKSNDCHTILSSVMENTVFNILQELFHGDIEEELLRVPRKAANDT